MKKVGLFLLLAATFAISKPVVTTSIAPTKYFIEQIAKDTIDVNVMVKPNSNPHTYEPDAKQMRELENSKLYFAVGTEFEKIWLDKFKQNYPKLVIVKTQNGITKIPMQDEDEFEEHEHKHHKTEHKHEHKHGKKHDHESEHKHSHNDHDEEHHHHHDELDPHIWLDPILVKIQAKNIAGALAKQFPENREFYKKNLKEFNAKLDELNTFIDNKLKNVRQREFIVYHPSWGYFAKRYNLTQIPIEINGKDPKPAQLARLIDAAKDHDIKVIFISPRFSKKAANLIANEIDANVIAIDELPIDWLKNMKETAEAFDKNL